MRISITDWVQEELKRWIHKGDTCVDATVGNGGDTLFLCKQTGSHGNVIGFDVQKLAISSTKERLEAQGYEAQLHQVGHEHMADYIKEECVSVIMFNLGYLPKGDHHIATKPETTIKALEQSITLLKKGGVISLCIYSGGDSGFEEKRKVLDYLKALDERKFLVIEQKFYNKAEHAPLPVLIIKLS